jgi:hypothetical protein
MLSPPVGTDVSAVFKKPISKKQETTSKQIPKINNQKNPFGSCFLDPGICLVLASWKLVILF